MKKKTTLKLEDLNFEDHGIIHQKEIIDKSILDGLENDILLVTNKRNLIELSDYIVELDRNDKKSLFELNKFISKHPVISLLAVKLMNDTKNLAPNTFPVYLGGSILLGLPNDKRLSYTWHQESNYMPGFKKLYNSWTPIFKNSEIDNGTMSVIIGSHKHGKLDYNKISSSNGYIQLETDVSNFNLKESEFWCCIPSEIK